MPMPISLDEAYKIIFTEFPDVVGVPELSKMLGICTKKVYQLLRSGKIKSIPCVKTYKVAKISVIEYMLSQNAA